MADATLLDKLKAKIQGSRYQAFAETYYQTHNPTNSLYIEVLREGIILLYNGWEYKRGQEGIEGITQSEFKRIKIDRNRWRIELALAVCFARRARKDYHWNVIPVFDGYELDV